MSVKGGSCICVHGIDFPSFYDFLYIIWNCYSSVLLYVFHLPYRTCIIHVWFLGTLIILNILSNHFGICWDILTISNTDVSLLVFFWCISCHSVWSFVYYFIPSIIRGNGHQFESMSVRHFANKKMFLRIKRV
jgi:hypothetical protein